MHVNVGAAADVVNSRMWNPHNATVIDPPFELDLSQLSERKLLRDIQCLSGAPGNAKFLPLADAIRPRQLPDPCFASWKCGLGFKGKQWIAKYGVANAQNNLGWMYVNGRGGII